MIGWRAIVLLLAVVGLVQLPMLTVSAGGTEDPTPSFRSAVRPFLEANCFSCHGEKLQMQGLRLDVFADAAAALESRDVFQKIREKLRRGEMPPPGIPRPDPTAVRAVIDWIEGHLGAPEENLTPDPGRVTARRLNRAEYNNTVRDLLGVDLRAADDFPTDDAGYGFDNIGDILSLPPLLMEKYMASADRIARAAIAVRPTAKPTFEKYLAPRQSTQGTAPEGAVPFSPEGAFRITHRFLFTGEYELRVRVVDRRFRPKKDKPPPPRPAAAEMAVSLDGRRVKLFQVDPDHYERGTYDVPLELNAGEHEIAAEFLSDGMKGIVVKEDPDDPYLGERKLFVDNIILTGPLRLKRPPLPESHRRLMVCGDPDGGFEHECAWEILSRLLPRAYRRPVRTEEVDALVRLAAPAEGEGETFAHGIRLALKAILISPHFLFRIERDPDPLNSARAHEVNAYELATRLSYFLWSSMPDDELFQAARKGNLGNPEVLEEQVRRMLRDPKSGALVENFAGQWLQLRNLETVAPDPDRFPDFDEALRAAMRRETEMFFETVIREDRSILEFLDAPYTFLNERLARHYGMEGIRGDFFRRVRLDGEQRGGVLTQASVLTVSSYATRTSPVLRGKWLLENILGAPPPSPPDGVPELDETKVGLAASLREQLEQHRADPTCAVCHAKIDPLGFSLENYDAVGAWRTDDGGVAVDSSGTLADGRRFTGSRGLRRILLEQKDDFALCLTEKMLTYGLGRGLEAYDQPTVKEIVRRIGKDGYRFSRLVLEIVNSMPFRMRRGEGSES